MFNKKTNVTLNKKELMKLKSTMSDSEWKKFVKKQKKNAKISEEDIMMFMEVMFGDDL